MKSRENSIVTTNERMLTLTRSRFAQRLSYALLCMLIIFLFFQTYRRGLQPLGSDLRSFLESSQALLRGNNSYQTESAFPYLYPLFLAFILIPLSLIPLWLSTGLWFLANMSAFLYAISVVPNLALDKPRINRHELWGVPLLVLFGLMFNPIQNEFVNGQVNSIILLCCVLFLKNLLEDRKLLASILLAVGISVKLFPLLLVVFLLFRKEYRIAAITGAGTVLFCIAPALLLGRQAGPVLIDYIRSIIVEGGFLSAQAHGHPAQYTFAGFVSFWFPAVARWPLLKPVCGLMVLMLLVVLEVHRLRHGGREGDPAAVWRFCLYLTAMLLIVPMSETHYQLFIIPAVSLFALALWADPRKISLFLKGGFLLFIAFFYAGKLVKNSPFYFLAISVLFALFFFILWRGQPIPSPIKRNSPECSSLRRDPRRLRNARTQDRT